MNNIFQNGNTPNKLNEGFGTTIIGDKTKISRKFS